MTVRENMAFPLKLKKYPKEEIRKRVDQAAEVLGITEYLDRQAQGPLRRPAPAGGHWPGHRAGAQGSC